MRNRAQVELRAVSVQFDSLTALSKVDVRLGEPGVTGLIGANGAGKTTLIHVVLGLLSPTTGDVVRSRGRVAYCPDTPSFEPFLTGEEVLQQSAALSMARRAPDVRAVLDRVGLAAAARRRVGGYSRGMKQRLGVAAALVTDPHLLILDEPTSALDPTGREETMDLIAALGERISVVFSSHILGDVERVAQRLTVLDKGSLLFSGSTSALLTASKSDPKVILSLGEGSGTALADLRGAGVTPVLVSESAQDYEFFSHQTSAALTVLSRHPRALRGLNVGRRSLQLAFDDLIRAHKT